MAGFDNDVVYGTNLDFSTAGALGGNATILTDGQMLIGTTALNVGGTHINVGTITSPNSSIVVGFSTPNITLQTNKSIIGAWTDEATSFAAASGNGYFCAAALTATLPASPSQGDVITSSAIGDSLQLVYRFANSEWFSVSSIGNWTLA